MPKPVITAHARDMLVERNISEEWIYRVINKPDQKFLGDDGNMHYISVIHELSGRVLHIVINERFQPNRIVTLFYDRRFARSK